MKIIFQSNYFTHHQKPFADALDRNTNIDFYFAEEGEMEEERLKLGWGTARKPSYVVSEKKILKEIDKADVLIVGSGTSPISKRASKRAVIFRYSERPLKRGSEPLKYIPRLVRWHKRNPKGKNIYLLSASAYAVGDYASFGLFRSHSYKWGYFPELLRYEDVSSLIFQKEKTKILWCGRFLEWKHADDAIEVGRQLREAGFAFELDLIGTGEMESELQKKAEEFGLMGTHVHFLGAMSPEAVRRHMERAGIYLFTSDYQEGWGAVLNEAMNSACAVIASDAAGATPYLIENGRNGSVYHSGNVTELYGKVCQLLKNPTLQRDYGKAAYYTITNLWNAEIAAERLLQLSQAILNGNKEPDLFMDGPCSRAEVIREDWYIK